MITQKHELYGVEKHMSAIIVENLTFSYPGSYDNIFENTSFQLDTSWKLGLVGRNGRGKTSLIIFYKSLVDIMPCMCSNE